MFALLKPLRHSKSTAFPDRLPAVKSGQVRAQDPCGIRTRWPALSLPAEMARQLLHAQLYQCHTVTVSDGRMEIGTAVPLHQVRDAMQDWFCGKSYLPKDSKLSLEEI
jgi:hypothetical protein